MNNLQESIVNAMEMVAGEYLTRAGYDRTIQATVLACVDEATGKYRIKYQDSKFYAYAANVETKYADNSQVYILIPGNDMTMHKTILGSVKNEGLYGSKVLPKSAHYLDYGLNLIELKKDFGLCSYKSKKRTSYVKINVEEISQDINPKKNLWYNYDQEEEEYILTEDDSIQSGKDYYYLQIDNLNQIQIFSEKEINKSSDPEKDIYYETDKVKINLAGIKEYILDNSSVDTLKIGGIFATKLPEEQRRQGNYGLNFVFTGKLAGETTTREFTMTVQDMEGDPYRYFVDSEQTTYLELGDFTFEKLKSIIFYAEDFPVIDFENPHNNDIFLKGIIFQGCESLTNEEVRGVYLKLTTPQGTIFYPYKDMLELSLIAEVYNGGTPVKSDSNSLGYYWFEERATAKDDIGGKGWYSLNGVDATTGKTVPSNNVYKVKKSDIPFYSKTYQSVAVYNAQKFSKTVQILNYEAKYKMELSTSKTIFNEKETASAEIELKLYHRDYPSQDWEPIEDFSNFIIKWYGEDSYKNYRELEYKDIKKVSISDFNKFYKVHCTVEKRDDNTICGSETLTLTKVSGTNEPFTLEIINDNGDFVYNEEGIAPTNESLGNPITIQPLRFSIYDNINGINIDTSSIPAEKIIWRFPLKSESLISPQAGEEQDGYLVLNGNEVGFTLDDTYSIEQNVNNRVYLDVTYGKYSLRTWIDIHCRKEGENGTNGTGYSLTIEPTMDAFKNSLIPIICFYKDGDYFKPLDEFLNNNNSNWFNVSLWLHGERVFTGSTEGLGVKNDDDSIYKISWEFKQHTQNGWREERFYNVEKNIFSINLDNQNHLCNSNGQLITEENRRECLEKTCHILQVTVEYRGQTIIASQPIGTLFIESQDSNNKTINLKSGFKEVIYRADGTQVKYRNNTPLTLWYMSEGKWENVPEDEVIWEACGKYPIVNGSTTEWIESNDLILKGEEPNEYLSPVDTYSGFCYTNAAVANINIKYGENSSNAFIHLPIHFYLNRYANKAINGWDGNAININEEEGIILSPQVGAGKKEQDNSFTGVVIGVSKVIDDNSDSRQEKVNTGLFGYTHGQQSIFLDSETGSATFGIEKVGQIKINPGINDYGQFNADPNIQSGSYQSKASGKEGSGLSIGFGVKPYITYGSRKFTVDPEGNVVMQDATVEGCFFARNKNTEDESEILIGTDPTNTNRQRASHIYLYDYYKDELNDLKQLSYIKIKPGNLDVTVKDIAAEDNDPKDKKEKSYLRFDADKGLQLKGEFRCKTYNTDVVFSNSSFDTQIEFWSYQDDDQIKSDLTLIENQKTDLYQTLVISKAIPAAINALTIRYTNLRDQYKEDCPYSQEEVEDFIKSWVRDYEILVENQGIYNEIINLTQNLISLQNNEDNLKQQISKKKEQIKSREKEKVVNGEFVDDEKLALINLDISSYENDINNLISQIKSIQNQKKDIEDTIEQKLISVGYHLVGNREYQDFVDEVGTGTSPSFDIVKAAYEFYNIHTLLNYGSFVPLLKIDSFSFDLAGIINEAFTIESKIAAANFYKTYIAELKQKEKAKRAIEDAEHPLKTKSLWSPSEFYFNVYDDKGENVISGISYNSETQNLTYIGGVDFEAPPYARLKMTTDKYKDSKYDAGEIKGENASELYFKTFFLNETGEIDTANPKSQIILKAGYLKVGAKSEPNAEESSLTMRNGKLELKNVEFAIKTYASDIAFTNKPSTTHIRLYNYERTIDEETGAEEKSLKSSVRITPSLFAVQGTGSSLHYNPNNGRLNYTGNINVSNSKGLFRLDQNDMVLRFGTTVGDYVQTEEDEADERYSGVPKSSKVTDFRLSSNGFSIRSYGKKTSKSIDTNNQIEYSDKNAKSAAEQWQDFVNSKSSTMNESSINRIIESFGKEIIAEDNVQTDNPQAFEENYWANFTVPESEINSWNNSDLSEQDSSISVPIHDFKEVETGGSYILNQAGEYEYVGEGKGNYVWQDAGVETIEVPQSKLPSFLESDEKIEIHDGSEAEKTWAETSGIYYNAKTGKFRLNGDFAVRNDHGSVILSDDLMRIMFKTYEKNDDGTDSDQIATRMCISEDSFYFYSFGEVKILPEESDIIDDKHGKIYYDNFRTIEHGITGAITWRDGILRIIGSIYADSGYIGGWTIERQRLSSSSGNAILDGATGNLFLSSGSSSGGGTTKGNHPAGQVCSEFGSRRSRIAYGQFFIEGIGENVAQVKAHTKVNEALRKAVEDLKGLCEILNQDSNSQKYKVEKLVSNKEKSNAKIVPDLVDIENYELAKGQIEDLYNEVLNKSTYSEEAKKKAEVLKIHYDDYEKKLKKYNDAIAGNVEEDEERGITYWGHQAHLISGYGAAQGAMLASEGYRKLNEKNSSPVGKTEWYNPVEKGTPLTEISYIEDGQDYSYNNINFGIGVNFEGKYDGKEPSEKFKKESVDKCVASFVKQCSPENKSETIASLSFVQKRDSDGGFIYGTEIFPHVVKTKDVFLTDSELQGEYNSSSLVGMLKELHQIPKKITYIDKETDPSEYSSLEGYSLQLDDNTAYIVEEWERESKYYRMSEETDERGIRALERTTVKVQEENESETSAQTGEPSDITSNSSEPSLNSKQQNSNTDTWNEIIETVNNAAETASTVIKANENKQEDEEFTKPEYKVWKLTLEPTEDGEEVDVKSISLLNEDNTEGMSVDLSGFVVHLPC